MILQFFSVIGHTPSGKRDRSPCAKQFTFIYYWARSWYSRALYRHVSWIVKTTLNYENNSADEYLADRHDPSFQSSRRKSESRIGYDYSDARLSLLPVDNAMIRVRQWLQRMDSMDQEPIERGLEHSRVGPDGDDDKDSLEGYHHAWSDTFYGFLKYWTEDHE